MTPQEHADRVIQQSSVDAWQPQFGKGTLIRLLRANIAWEIEQVVKEAQYRGSDWTSSYDVSDEGASWAMEASERIPTIDFTTPRARKVVLVSPELLFQFFTKGHVIHAECAEGLPVDARFCGFNYDFQRDCYYLCFESAEFEPVKTGCILPELPVIWVNHAD